MRREKIVVDLTPGTLYRCLLRLDSEPGHLYRVYGLATHYPSRQPVVVYEGVDGPDAGRLFVCPAMDFAVKFRPVDPPRAETTPTAAPPVVERVADFTSRGRY